MKFLVIRLGSLGDVVLATAVVEVLKESFPDSEIDFLVKREYGDILSGNPKLGKVIPFDARGKNGGMKGVLAAAETLRSRRYTHVIDLHANLRSRLICALLPGTKKLRYNKQSIKRRLLVRGWNVETRHTLENYLGALSPLGIGERKALPRIYLPAGEIEAAEKLLEEHDIGQGSIVIGLSPGARWSTKMWPEERFVETGKMITDELGAAVLVFGGPEESGLAGRIAAGIGEKALPVAGLSGLKGSAALMARCAAFLTNDSGPMHMAAAVGTPVVAIFGPTVRGLGFSPLGRSRIIERELPCRPCSLHGADSCPAEHFECMKGIGASDVFEKIREIMK